MKRLLCIRLPSWPIQRLVVAQPELNGRIIILHVRDPRRGQCVLACSRAAYRCGVRPHMSLAEATSLQQHAAAATRYSASAAVASTVIDPSASATANRPTADNTAADNTAADGTRVDGLFPQRPHTDAPYIAEHNPQADADMLEQLAQWCERFSPLVGFEQLEPFHSGASPQQRRDDCLYLEVTNIGPYFDGEHKLARLVAEAFSHRGYLARVAIADTLGAAWALAHFALHDATAIGPLSAARQRSSFLVVPPGATVTALQSLPVQALRLPHDTQSLLQQLGIFQMAQLARLPRASLLSRFGNLLLKRWDQACGHVDEVLIAHHPAPQFQTDWVLEHPTTNQAAIQSILSTLLERLTTALEKRGEGVMQCICRLTPSPPHSLTPSSPHSLTPSSPHSLTPSSPHSPLSLRIGLFQPTACTDHLQQLFLMQLERLHLPGPVEQVVLEASHTAPLERRQRELFSDAKRHTSQHLPRLVDRLSSRLGSANVVQARLQTDAQPEFAYRYLPLTGRDRHLIRVASRPSNSSSQWTSRSRSPKVSSRASSAPRTEVRRRLIRPLHLRSPPLPLAVIALAPDGPPAQLLLGKRTYRVTRCWGPERIETGWWRGYSVRRDYYRLETHSGHWLWVFRQLTDNRWFLHGMFG